MKKSHKDSVVDILWFSSLTSLKRQTWYVETWSHKRLVYERFGRSWSQETCMVASSSVAKGLIAKDFLETFQVIALRGLQIAASAYIKPDFSSQIFFFEKKLPFINFLLGVTLFRCCA